MLSPAAAQVLLRSQPKPVEPAPSADPRSRMTLLTPTPRDMGLTVVADSNDPPETSA